MTALGGESPGRSTMDAPENITGLEIATVSADTLRANIRVTGTVAPAAASLLTSVLRTHVSAGRRYLRLDLAAACIEDNGVIQTLMSAHRSVAELGGMLVFESAGPQVVDALRAQTLHVRPAR